MDQTAAHYAPQVAGMQLQRSHATELFRYHELFNLASSRLNARGRVLSFGCSNGDEVFSLAARYFNHSEIVGVDISREILRIAAARTDAIGESLPLRDNKISFHHHDDLPRLGKFDCIFAMSVLCIWPPKENMMQEMPYGTFLKAVDEIDAALKPGGILVLYNTMYVFETTAVAANYRPIPVEDIGRPPFVYVYKPDGKRTQPPKFVVFEKNHTLSSSLKQRLKGVFR